jgi:predicted NBD/HSP70 family sugar kinase
MKTSPIDSKNAGLQNENLLLSILRRHGEISQAQLCKQAGLSSSTTSYIVGRLREKNLILEERGQSSRRGAKPVIVSINPSGRFVVGIEINPTDVFLGLFNFNCRLVESVRVLVGEDRSPQTIVNLLEISARGLLAKHNVPETMLAGIGVTLSGSISRDGVVELSSPLGWKSIPLRHMLQSRFTAAVSLHTTRVRLLAENSVNPEISGANTLYINVGNGVGSHAIIDGRLVHGCDDRSGEIGHIVIDPDGPLCGCGHRGCLEAFISGPALAEKIRRESQNTDSILAGLLNESDLPKDVIAKWAAALASNDLVALTIRDYLGLHLAKVAAIAINCYDPQIVMLAGYVVEACAEFCIEQIRRRIETDVFDNLARSITIIPARAGELALVLGVATAILQNSRESTGVGNS